MGRNGPRGQNSVPQSPAVGPSQSSAATPASKTGEARQHPAGAVAPGGGEEASASPSLLPAGTVGGSRKSRNRSRRARSRAKSAHPIGSSAVANNIGPLARLTSTNTPTNTDGYDATGEVGKAEGGFQPPASTPLPAKLSTNQSVGDPRSPVGTPLPPKQSAAGEPGAGRSRSAARRAKKRAKSMQPPGQEAMVVVWACADSTARFRSKEDLKEYQKATGQHDLVWHPTYVRQCDLVWRPKEAQAANIADAAAALPASTEKATDNGQAESPDDCQQQYDLTIDTATRHEAIAITDPLLKQKLEERRRRAEEGAFTAGDAAPTAEKPQMQSGSALWKLADLQDKDKCQAAGLEMNQREQYLSDADFNAAFGTTKELFAALPEWKRNARKKDHGLF